MAVGKPSVGEAPIIATADALANLCPDLQDWPQRWRGEASDVALGERILECFKPFLLQLLGKGLATTTLRRHRDHLWMLGGEIIRRCYDESDLSANARRRSCCDSSTTTAARSSGRESRN